MSGAASAEQTAVEHTAPGESEVCLLPTSFVQRGVWAVDRVAPRHGVLAVPEALRMTGRLDLTALRRALEELGARHEALRSAFREVDGVLMAEVHTRAAIDLEVVDLTGYPDPGTEADRRIADVVAQAPDLSQAPLLHAVLLRLAPDDHILVAVSHLMVYDSASRDLFAGELGMLYRAFAIGMEPVLPPLPLQYADVAHWQNESLAAGTWQEQFEYWRERLPAAGSARRQDSCDFNAQTHHAAIPAELLAAAEQLGAAHEASLFMVLLTIYQTLLADLTGQTDVTVGTPVLCRDRREFERIIGRFVNYVAIRTDVEPGLGFADLLARVRRGCLAAFAHRDVPLEYLQETLLPGTPLDQDPWFRATFVLHTAAAGELGLPGLTVRAQPVLRHCARYDLELHVWPTDSGAQVRLLRNTSVLSADVGEALVRHFVGALRVAVETHGLADGRTVKPDENEEIAL